MPDPEFNSSDYSDIDKEFADIRRRRLGLAIIGTAGITMLAGTALWAAPKAPGLFDGGNEPRIIAGVPGQVEGHDTGKVCRQRSGANCIRYEDVGRLRIEQCPQDADNSRGGEVTRSFDPQVGKIALGCFVAILDVDKTTYRHYPLGSTITPTDAMRD